MVGVFEELQRKRLNRLHGDVGTEFVDIITDLASPADLPIRRQQNLSLQNCRVRIRKLQEETRVAKRQLEKMIENIQTLKAEVAPNEPEAEEPKAQWPGIEMRSSTERYLRRFKDICIEYEGIIAVFELWSDELALSREHVS